MYKSKEIEELRYKLEGGELSPSECMSRLSVLNRERLDLKERCEALNTLAYIERAQQRAKRFDTDPVRSDAFLQIKDAWNNARPLTNTRVKELIRYTSAYESGLIDLHKLEALDILTPTFKEAMENLKNIIK